MKIGSLTEAMIKYMSGDARRIQHFLKVHCIAKFIGERELLDSKLLFTLEAAALTHDIGIKNAEFKYGKGHCTGKMQEVEGPPIAATMMAKLGCDEDIVDRVCFLIGHHHTYTNIEGLDYQILVEADFLVNFYEDGMDKEKIVLARNKLFKTKTGIELCNDMFAL